MSSAMQGIRRLGRVAAVLGRRQRFAQVRQRRGAVVVGDLEPQVGIHDDHPAPGLAVRGGRRLDGELEAFEQHLALDRAVEVEALAHRAGGREQQVGVGYVNRLVHARIVDRV